MTIMPRTTLKSAAEVGRLDSTTSQRVILGCILPCISHYVAFKSVRAAAMGPDAPGHFSHFVGHGG